MTFEDHVRSALDSLPAEVAGALRNIAILIRDENHEDPDLFGLFEARDGVDLLDHFARAGILVRGFAAAPRHYRFGLPADEAAWRRLEAACGTLSA